MLMFLIALKQLEPHKKNTIHYHHQQLLWGVPLLPTKSQLLTKKVKAKLRLRLSETALLVISSPVADTKDMLRAISKIQVWTSRKQRLVKFLVGPFMGQGQFVSIIDYGTGNPYTSSTPLISGEIGEDFLPRYLTESEQTPSAVGLNVLLDEEDKVKVAGGFMLQVLPGAGRRRNRSLRKTHPRDASHFNAFGV